MSKNIESIYPLAPLQEGILFHSLYDPKAGLYVTQYLLVFSGEFKVSAFRRAWQQVLDRHPILRTFFLWEGLDKPIQIVRQRVELPWDERDWRDLSPKEQEAQLEAYLEADRRRGFILSNAPLMRFLFIHLGEHKYQFIWSHHHLLLDGWSFALLLKEASNFYEAFSRDQQPTMELVRPYRDFIAWIERQDLSEAEAFWRQMLKGFANPTSLRIDQVYPTLPGLVENHEVQQSFLSAATTEALASMVRKYRLTVNSLVQGAWALLLGRYSGEEDVVFGTVSSGRPVALEGVESMVGLFINTLPMRVRISPGMFCLAWLKKIQDQQIEMRQYEYTPLSKVQSWSEVPRGIPLFETILAFENYPTDQEFQKPFGGRLEIYQVRSIERTNYPITVQVGPGSELLVKITYDGARFEKGAISRMLGHFKTLLEGIVANPEQRISDLPLLTEGERRQVVVEWNETGVEYPRGRCVHELFEEQVERRPDAVAVVMGEEQFTYRELNERANQVAHHLQQLGVGPEVLVGVYLERSLEMVVGILGILKAGGAYVPLDLAYPKDRVGFMLQDSGAPVLLTNNDLVERLPDHGARVVLMDSDWPSIGQESRGNPLRRVTSKNLAYVIYTSGSTGVPKGVEIEHEGLVNLVFWHQRVYRVTAADRATQLAGLSFDASVWEIWPYLTAGASVYLPDEETRVSPRRLVEWLAGQGITICFLPTPLAEAVLSEEWPRDVRLRVLLTGGDKLRRPPKKILPFSLINNYGPTENTVVSTWTPVAADPEADTPPPIGRPVDNTQCYVLDAYLQPVPIGVAGELHIGGVGLARGYLNRPELTAEKFIPHPFCGEAGARLYKTGDLVRYLPDGNLEFLGRIDHQVKIRGYRIELGEIEALMGSHPGVGGTVVMVRDDMPGAKLLVAYIVPRGEQAPSVEGLRQYLREKLPEYMVPSAFVMLEEFPLSPNGKIDRRALPKPEVDREAEKGYVAPRNEAEEAITKIWRELLQVRTVGINDNFFELGGHSLLLVKMLDRLQESFKKELAIVEIFRHPTIATLASYLTGQEEKELSLEKVFDLVEKQKESLKRQKRVAVSRRKTQ